MEIKINIVELASNLALDKLTKEVMSNNKSLTEEDVERIIYQESGNDIVFREEFQLLFEQYYDEFWEMIENTKV